MLRNECMFQVSGRQAALQTPPVSFITWTRMAAFRGGEISTGSARGSLRHATPRLINAGAG